MGYVARRRWRVFWWTLAGVVTFPVFLAGLFGWGALLAAMIAGTLGK